MKIKQSKRKITSEVYDNVKVLVGLKDQDGNQVLTNKKIYELAKVGESTVYLIKRTSSFEEYKAIKTAERQRWLQKVKDKSENKQEEPEFEKISPKLVEKVETLEEKVKEESTPVLAAINKTNVLLSELLVEVRSKKKWF